jgi:hypothetical protein
MLRSVGVRLALALAGVGMTCVPAWAQSDAQSDLAANQALLDRYCVTCHNSRLETAGLDLSRLDLGAVGETPARWEAVVRKLRGGMMPPAGRPRPDEETYTRFTHWLEAELDQAASASAPGRVPTHRLNRVEYANAVRDLLAVDVDPEELLPTDDIGHGFDNLAGTLTLSPVLMERYLSAARRISRLAIGDPSIGPGFTSERYVVPIDLAQNDRMDESLPFGSRGGVAIRHRFPLDGEYDFTLRLKRSVYEYIVNLDEPHDLDLRIDGERVARFTVGGQDPPGPAPLSFSGTFVAAGDADYPTQAWDDYRTGADADLRVRLSVSAGSHRVSASFVGRSWEAEGVLQPPLREYGATVTETTDTTPRPEGPGLESLAIDGPYTPSGPGSTRSRDRIFVCHTSREPTLDARECATRIFGGLARRAFRRPVSNDDLVPLLSFFEVGQTAGGFERGVQHGLERLLIDPEFLFRVERDPIGLPSGTAYTLSDLELASRLSFFLWSSLPDEELLELAARDALSQPETLARQVRRMLGDPRSEALIENFVGQWLSLRSVDGVTPDPNLFPNFDENLRRAMRRETEMFVGDQLRRDQSVVDLLAADYSFLNERLAQHYGIAGVVGSHFRRVDMPDTRRGGLIGQASILAVTSYGNRTSPVLRAKWLLETLFGSPPPPPPPDIPPLPDAGPAGEPRTVRERLAQHRRSPACAVCHAPMDPLGFALENFDAVGRWRTTDLGMPIDASAVLADGTTMFEGPAGLRDVLLNRSDQFVETLTEKLLVYAVGRGLEYYDRPVLRAITRRAAEHDHRWSSIIQGIVESPPFRMRTTE